MKRARKSILSYIGIFQLQYLLIFFLDLRTFCIFNTRVTVFIKTQTEFFRIKMDFKDTIEDVYTMHKQMGLVHYFAAYKKQPFAYQHTSDPGDEIIITVTKPSWAYLCYRHNITLLRV